MIDSTNPLKHQRATDTPFPDRYAELMRGLIYITAAANQSERSRFTSGCCTRTQETRSRGDGGGRGQRGRPLVCRRPLGS